MFVAETTVGAAQVDARVVDDVAPISKEALAELDNGALRLSSHDTRR